MGMADEFRSYAEEIERDIKRATKRAVVTATYGAHQAIRARVTAASGERAGALVGADVYPAGDSANAAGQIYAKGDLANAILTALATGPTIVPRAHEFLTIPLPAAQALRAGSRSNVRREGGFGVRFSMPELIQKFGRKNVRSVPLKGSRGSVLILARAGRFGGKSAPWVPYFVLVRAVTYPRKLGGIEAEVQRFADAVPGLIARNLAGG